ncbi:MAG: homoserine O-acetyltransferase [Bacteroidota bacterium]
MEVTEGNLSIGDIKLECGEELNDVNIHYHILGNIHRNPSRVIWICHAFTANSNPGEWWPEMVGQGRLFDPDKYPIVCANIIGSCYGSTGPTSINPKTGKPYLRDFPLITFRDVVAAHQILKEYLGIEKVWILIGGSIGGFQAMEWECGYPGTTENLVLIATSTEASPWVRAFSQSQRLAILADQTFDGITPNGGKAGLKAARSIALLSYRGRSSYNLTQQDTDPNQLSTFKACTYQDYQGDKLVKRFNAYSYYTLSLMLDSHNLGRGRVNSASALGSIKARTLVIGIDSDILFPVEEQQFIANHIPNAVYREIHSQFCHDGFLIEYQQLTSIIKEFVKL